MDSLLDALREAGHATLGLLSLPYFYIAVFLVWWHARQGVKLQRRLFHVRLLGSIPVALSRLGAGVLAGIGISLISLAAGAQLTGGTLLCVWLAMVVLVLFRLRYICLAYAAGALGIVQAVVSAVVSENDLDGVAYNVIHTINEVNVPGLLFLAGLLHIAEGLLVRFQAAKTAIPLFIEGKRGKPVGAYALSGVWPIPLLWLVPAASGGAGGFELPWTPLFGIGGDTAGWSLLAFPVLIGFSDKTETFWPERKAKSSGYRLIIYGVAIAGLAAGGAFWAPLAIAASVAAFVFHEGLLLWSRWREHGRLLVYVQDGTGVRVLAVLPGTPAAELGLLAGEIIRKVNGVATRSKEELHAALQRQSAFCKLEVTNREGHIKFVQRARYAGEHHQLGLVLAPDDEADFVAAQQPASLWHGLARRRKGYALPGPAVGSAEAEMAAAAEGAAAHEEAHAAGARHGEEAHENAEAPGGAAWWALRSAVGPNSSATEPTALPPAEPGLPSRGSKARKSERS